MYIFWGQGEKFHLKLFFSFFKNKLYFFWGGGSKVSKKNFFLMEVDYFFQDRHQERLTDMAIL